MMNDDMMMMMMMMMMNMILVIVLTAYYILVMGMNIVLFLAKDDINGCEVISSLFGWPIGNIIQGGHLLVLCKWGYNPN